MIRHIVLWQLHDPADAPRFRDELLSCRGLVDGMVSFEVGLRSDGMEATCDVCLVSSFRDAAALDAYQRHPHHQAVGARIGPLRRERHVIDYEA